MRKVEHFFVYSQYFGGNGFAGDRNLLRFNERIGTPGFWCPELFNGDHTIKCDVFSFGKQYYLLTIMNTIYIHAFAEQINLQMSSIKIQE